MTAWETEYSNLFNQDLQQSKTRWFHLLQYTSPHAQSTHFQKQGLEFLPSLFSDLIKSIFPSWCMPEETSRGQKKLIEKAFQFELESKLSTGRERFVSFLHSRDVSLPAPTQSRYPKVFLQISEQPYLRSTYWHFTIFTPSSIRQLLSVSSMIWKTWDLSQAHIFTPEHEWEILKPFSREKSLCQYEKHPTAQ